MAWQERPWRKEEWEGKEDWTWEREEASDEKQKDELDSESASDDWGDWKGEAAEAPEAEAGAPDSADTVAVPGSQSGVSITVEQEKERVQELKKAQEELMIQCEQLKESLESHRAVIYSFNRELQLVRGDDWLKERSWTRRQLVARGFLKGEVEYTRDGRFHNQCLAATHSFVDEHNYNVPLFIAEGDKRIAAAKRKEAGDTTVDDSDSQDEEFPDSDKQYKAWAKQRTQPRQTTWQEKLTGKVLLGDQKSCGKPPAKAKPGKKQRAAAKTEKPHPGQEGHQGEDYGQEGHPGCHSSSNDDPPQRTTAAQGSTAWNEHSRCNRTTAAQGTTTWNDHAMASRCNRRCNRTTAA